MFEVIADFFRHIFDASLVVQLLCVAASCVLLLRGPDGRRKFWTRWLLFAAETVLLAAVFLVFNLALTLLARASGVFMHHIFMYLMGIAIYAAVRSRFKWTNRLVMASVVFSLSTLMAALGTTLGNAIEMNVAGFDIAVTKIISYLLVVACSVVFYRYPISRFETTPFDCVLNFVCNILSALLIIVYEYFRFYSGQMRLYMEYFSGYISIVIVFLFIINIVTYFMTYFLCKERERVLDYQAEKQKSLSLKELLSLSEHNMAELREVRHDIKNQYAYMQSMLEAGKYDELKSYFGELVGTFSKAIYECVDCGNVTVDAILNLELAKAQGVGVKMNVRAAIPAELPFAQSGLLALFTNVIDNAIEACRREQRVSPCVDVVLSLKGDYLLFCVINPVAAADTDEPESLPSAKSDKTLHGHGLKIVRKVVKKYNGYHRSYIKNGFFVSESLLDMHCNENAVAERGGGNEKIAEHRRMR